ncbi:MAG TPA: alpha/beta hydrolase [Oceanospirillaceae bacterium]|nr:alpha/beta hydrolase [Oceanospirillaceae bacterium]
MEPQFEYVEGQIRSTFDVLLARYAQLNNQTRANYEHHTDLVYGEHVRQRFDWFPGLGKIKGLVIYYHAGYWQSRDKSQFHFLAPNFVDTGWHFGLVNYPLCPEVSLQELTELVSLSLNSLREETLRGQDVPVILIGHSAGSQIAVELALANTRTAGLDKPAVNGVLGISGVYDPEPLIATSLNKNLRLTPATARAANVSRRFCAHAVPGLWVVGATETNAFLCQNSTQHHQWVTAGNASASIEVPNTDHFSVLEEIMKWPLGNNPTYNQWLADILESH